MPEYSHSAYHNFLNHSEDYIGVLIISGMFYAAADIAIANGAVTVLGSVTVGGTVAAPQYFIPVGYQFSIRAGTITVASIVDVWFRIAGTQRSAKVPVHVDPAAAVRNHVTIPFVPRGLSDVLNMGSAKTTSTLIEVVAERQASADPAANTALVSDRGGASVVAGYNAHA